MSISIVWRNNSSACCMITSKAIVIIVFSYNCSVTKQDPFDNVNKNFDFISC